MPFSANDVKLMLLKFIQKCTKASNKKRNRKSFRPLLRLFLNKSLMLSPFRGSGFFHGNDVHVDHNTSVVLLFSIARGENARERTLSCELCLLMPSFIIG